ncbi:MAG: hypothetical protein H6636_11285 [Anaerolineales bacterium]|nr:hypothetical protein [Anaerolineales bacterium]
MISLISLACAVTGTRETPTPVPPDLLTTPTPEGGVLGGLEGLYRSDPISNQTGCFDFLRLYEDGVVLSANACTDPDTGMLKVLDWFHRDNPDVIHGMYWTTADQIWMELPIPYLNKEIRLTDLRGRYCTDSLAVQTMHRYAQNFPSVSEPVTKYIRLDTAVVDPACHVATFYFLITLPGTPGGTLALVVQTVPDELCTLTYYNPNESTPFVENLPATADAQGKCVWEFSLPVDTSLGVGQAAVTVGGVMKVVDVRVEK